MCKQEDFQFTHMDGVSLLEINEEKKRVAKDVLYSALKKELFSYLDVLNSLDCSDFSDCQQIYFMLDKLQEKDLHLSPGGLHEAIGRISVVPISHILEYTTNVITAHYKDYLATIDAADESLISTQKWLEELAEQRNAEDFAADDFFVLEMSKDKDTAHYLPTPSKRYVSTLDYIKGQQLFNDKI